MRPLTDGIPAVTSAEPTVLAAAENTPSLEIDSPPDRYVVTETQYTQFALGGRTVPNEIRDRLAPSTTNRLAAGEPGLLGVSMPATVVLSGGTATTPVAVIEANGHDTNPATAQSVPVTSSANGDGNRAFSHSRRRVGDAGSVMTARYLRVVNDNW